MESSKKTKKKEQPIQARLAEFSKNFVNTSFHIAGSSSRPTTVIKLTTKKTPK